jgi:hypothetical protein
MTVDGAGYLLCWSCGHLIPVPADTVTWPPADGERIICSACHQLGVAASGAGGIILRRPTQLELLTQPPDTRSPHAQRPIQ